MREGDALVIIEDSEFRLRLAQAKSDLARAQQQSKQAGSSVRTASLPRTRVLWARATSISANWSTPDRRLSASWMRIAYGSKPTTARRNCLISMKVPRSLSMWTRSLTSRTKAVFSASPMPPVARTRSSPSTMLRATSSKWSNASPSASPWTRIAQRICRNSKPVIPWSAK